MPFSELENFNFLDDNIEKDFEFIQKIIKSIRVVRSDYNIPSKIKTDVYLICNDDKVTATIESFKEDIKALAYCSSNDIVKKAPAGCAILTINSQCEAHLMLKGIIEADKEIAKLEKKTEVLEQTILKLKQKMSMDGYAQKVPENVQQENIETLKESEIEIERIAAAVKALSML